MSLCVFFDESGEFEGQPHRLVNMTVGGCIASSEAWQAFAPKWKAVLDSESVECFHMVDFENYIKPFDWFLEDGSRNYARHQRFLNALLDVLLEHCSDLVGFNYFPKGEKRQLREAYKRCVQDAVQGCNRDLVTRFETELRSCSRRIPKFQNARFRRFSRTTISITVCSLVRSQAPDERSRDPGVALTG